MTLQSSSLLVTLPQRQLMGIVRDSLALLPGKLDVAATGFCDAAGWMPAMNAASPLGDPGLPARHTVLG